MKPRFTTLHNSNDIWELAEPVHGRKPVLALLKGLLWATVLLLPAFGTQAGVVVSALYSFGVINTNGANPYAGLVQGSDGNFYGTTFNGGTNGGKGTVFQISTNGALTSLYSFSGGTDGANPQAGLVQGGDGNFYGTTQDGGSNNYGTVFKISANGAFTSLYSFGSVIDTNNGNASDGTNPEAGLVEGSDGEFYGTTYNGGTNGWGTVFKISTNGALTSLYSFGTKVDFNNIPLDGGNPLAGLVRGSDSNFFGTTYDGGTNGGSGTVFQINANGVLTSLYSFTGGNDGANPQAGLVQGSDGNFYGTTFTGGTNTTQFGEGYGTVFQISTNGTLTTLYAFGTITNANGDPLDGAMPEAGLAQGSDGNFWGTTSSGGSATYYSSDFFGVYGAGTVFKISTNGALTTLYDFGALTNANGEPLDGASPQAGLELGSDGNFYGTTYNGGTNSLGTVFQITTNGALTNLYSFTAGHQDGVNPYAGLVQGNDGNFYGTTVGGGGYNEGTVFQISASGALTSLYSFTGGNDSGGYPEGGLVQGTDGSFYGTTAYGNVGYGSVFHIGTTGALTSLYSFNNGIDGARPQSGLVLGSDGNFYGTTGGGGAHGEGTVFRLGPNGALTNLYSFTGGSAGGADPAAGLVQGSDGNFYGTTVGGGTYGYGTVFQISTNGALTSLYSFTGGEDGGHPQAGLVQGSDGNFYGTASIGGTNHNDGTVFQISTNKVLETLYAFGTVTNANGDPLDGASPQAGLVQGSDGNFYGTTVGGGTYGYGTVFQISLNGALTSLYSFTGGDDGANPQAGLAQAGDGSFYGTTFNGGQGRAGTVFRLNIVSELPNLTIHSSGTNIILTWPANAAGFTLQSTTNLALSAAWASDSPPPGVVNGQNTVTNSISGTQQFYRLVSLP